MSGPTSPAEYGEGMNDEELAKDGWAVGLDVWGPVEKAYSNFVSDMTLANSQLWSLQCAIEARVRARLAEEIAAKIEAEAVDVLGDGYVDGLNFGVRVARAAAESPDATQDPPR